MTVFDLGDAADQLSQLVERAAAGEEIIIARDGRAIVRLVQLDPSKPAPRIPGYLKGRIHMREDFDDPLPEEILAAFRGERD